MLTHPDSQQQRFESFSMAGLLLIQFRQKHLIVQPLLAGARGHLSHLLSLLHPFLQWQGTRNKRVTITILL